MTQEQTQAINDAFSFIATVSSTFRPEFKDVALQICERHYTTLLELVGQDIADNFKHIAVEQMEALFCIDEQALRASNHLLTFIEMSDKYEPDTELHELADKLSEKFNQWLD